MTFFEEYVDKHRGYLYIQTIAVNFVRTLTVARYARSQLLQTEFIDDEGTTTLEVLKTWNDKVAVLLSRERFGPVHDDMRSYLRDNYYPVGSIVRLIRNA